MREIHGLQVAALAAICVAGCADAAEPLRDPDDSAIGETTQGLGESGCGTVAISPGSAQGTVLRGYGHCAWTSSSDSPNAAYGSPLCPDQYVVELTNTGSSTEAAPYAAVTDQPGRIACETTTVEMGVYGRRLVLVKDANGDWLFTWRFVLVGTRIENGRWIPEGVGPLFTMPAHCELTEASSTIPSSWRVSDHSAVRVAARASRLVWKWVNGGLVLVRVSVPVEVGLYDSNPC